LAPFANPWHPWHRRCWQLGYTRHEAVADLGAGTHYDLGGHLMAQYTIGLSAGIADYTSCCQACSELAPPSAPPYAACSALKP
jgi:hypothetical protein